MTTQTHTQTHWPDDLQRVMRFEEMGSDGFHRSWIMLFPQGEYEHPQYGDLTFSHAKLSEIKRQFDERVRRIDIALDANHDQDKATGWLEELALRPATTTGAPAGLWGLVRWTSYGMQLLKDQLYRYFSPEFGPWTDPASGTRYDNVLIGGGLTNRPFLKEMPAVQLAEVSQKSWASVDKSKLPAACFLIVGDRAKKSTWRLPVYEGAGAIGSDGMYTRRGPLNLNAVRAALAALGGARSGKPMTGVPSGVRAKLAGWLKRYGGTSRESESSQQASESADGGAVEESRMPRTQTQQAHNDTLEFDEETQSFASKDSAKGASADDEDAEEMDDGEDDSESYDDSEAEGDGEDDASESDKSQQRQASAKRGGKGAQGAKSGKGDKQMSEGPRTLADFRAAHDTQAQQLAEMREQLYQRDVADTLKGWDDGKFQFSEAPKLKNGAALPMVALSKRFRDQYTALMLGEAASLPSAMRKAINRVIETGLSAAVVDLSQRGASFDQERRRTVHGGAQGQRAAVGDEILDLAEKLAEQGGKRLSELSYDEKLRLMGEAERQTGSNTLPF